MCAYLPRISRPWATFRGSRRALRTSFCYLNTTLVALCLTSSCYWKLPVNAIMLLAIITLLENFQRWRRNLNLCHGCLKSIAEQLCN
ncbi:uncharacterized protein [Euphorbia lathyris]|uniref:uncharacterized protein isoform X4 n=1 Tax=Euphorbia lathyris TaxID=212925 RepID=UPI003313F130